MFNCMEFCRYLTELKLSALGVDQTLKVKFHYDLTPDWQGIVLVADPEQSRIAKTLGITVKGKYALKVT